MKRTFRNNMRGIPDIDYEEEITCLHCKKKFEINISVDPDQVFEAIDDFIDETSEQELLEWAGPEHVHNWKVVEYVEENIEQMCLGLITKDQFIEELISVAKIERNLIDVQNLK